MNHRGFVEELSDVSCISFDRENDTRYAIQAYTVDFTVGSRDMYPSGLKDDLPRMLTRSSVSLTPESGDYSIRARDEMPEEFDDDWHAVCDEATIHLPPYEHGMEDSIEAFFDLKDDFAIRYGTTGMGTRMPPADWGLTPHVELVDERCSIARILRVIRQACNAIENAEPMTVEEVRAAYTSYEA